MSRTSPPRLTDHFDAGVLSLLGSLDVKAKYVVEGFLNGLHRSPFHGLSVEFSEYRDYQPGDDLRHLDWQLYARTDRLCVKKYTQDTNVRVYIVIDSSASMSYRGNDAWASKLEAARVVAAAMTSMLLRQNDAVGLLTLEDNANGPEFIEPSQKPSQFGVLLGHLQNVEASGGARLAPLLNHAASLIHRRSMVLFFSDLLEDSQGIMDCFRRLRFDGHECLVFQMLDRDEIEFPFDRNSVFLDLESGIRRTVDVTASRERYLERFGRFMDQRRQAFANLEIPHLVVRNDRPPWEALTTFLGERRRLA